MPILKNYTLFLVFLLTLVPGLFAQTAPLSPVAPKGPETPTQASAPSESSSMAGTTLNNANTNSMGSGQYGGTWVVERAIYEHLTVLRDVSTSNGKYYQKITFGNDGQGTILYRDKGEAQSMEYLFKSQDLTIAYGSRLKPQNDLFQVVLLNDGTLFLKSRRLGSMNGSMLYFLKKEKQ
jgi:hypothetical protein